MTSWKLVFWAIPLCCACEPSASDALLSRLPADNEVSGWSRPQQPKLVESEMALYNQIDGAGPKYLERGWVAAVYARYWKGQTEAYVNIHDMGSAANARSIFTFDLATSRMEIDSQPNAYVDLSGAESYSGRAWTGKYYVEVGALERTDASRTAVVSFIRSILAHGS